MNWSPWWLSWIPFMVLDLGDWEDKICWKPYKKNGFKVGTYYHFLDTGAITSEHPFPWKIIWRSKAPLRVAFFVWTVALGKILIIDNLRKIKVRIIDWCYMCKCNGESIDYLLLHCLIASDLWSMILVLFGVSWVMPKSVVELLACWQGCLVVIEMVIFVWLSSIAWCGAFGGKEIARVMKTAEVLCLTLSCYFLEPYWLGLADSHEEPFFIFYCWFIRFMSPSIEKEWYYGDINHSGNLTMEFFFFFFDR